MLNEVLLRNLSKDDDKEHFTQSREERIEALIEIMRCDLSSAKNFRQIILKRAKQLNLEGAKELEKCLDDESILNHRGTHGNNPNDNFRQLQRVATEQYIKYVLPLVQHEVLEKIKDLDSHAGLRRYLYDNKDVFTGLEGAYLLEGETDNPGLLTDDAIKRIRKYASELGFNDVKKYQFQIHKVVGIIKNNEHYSPELKEKLIEYIHQIMELTRIKKIPLKETIKLLIATNRFLSDPGNQHDNYLNLAKDLTGQPSLAYKILGGLMMAIGALMFATGIALAATTVAFGPAVSVVGMGMAAGGVCFFNAGQTHRSRAIAEDIVKDVDASRAPQCI